jgi:uncharacterized phage protein (predicted DNA packaging)
MTLDEAKTYLRVDGNEDNALIESLIASSAAYLTNAGAQDDGNLYKLAQLMLISHWYENREPEGKADKLAYGLSGIILQLQLAEVPDATG